MNIAIPKSYLMLLKYVFVTAIAGMILGVILAGILAFMNVLLGCERYDSQSREYVDERMSKCWSEEAQSGAQDGSVVGLVLGGIFGGLYALKRMKSE